MVTRVLVAGATGRIGQILGQIWGAAPPDRQQIRFTGRRIGGPVGVDDIACRFDAPERLAELLSDCDVVLDLAGPTRAPGADLHHQHPALFDAMAAVATCPIVTMSTSAIYGRGADRSEATDPAPEGGYGRAKLDVEARVTKTAGAAALRLGNVGGADALLGRVEPGKRVQLHQFSDGTTPRRSYLGPISLADILAQICDKAARGDLPKVLNLCGPTSVEMGALLDMANLPWDPVPAPVEAIRALTLSPDLLARHIDLPPKAGAAETVIAEWRRVFD